MLTACTAAIEKPTDTAEVTANTAASQNKKNTETSKTEETASAAETQPAEAYTEEPESDGEMSLEEKVGQILLARFPESGAAETMEKYQLGGYTVYARDLENETPESMRAKLDGVQSAAKIPAFIAVDEEGGKIVRVSKFSQYRSEPFMSQTQLAEGGADAIEADTREKAQLLSSLGINLNLAPVADITDNPEDYIYDRTFGSDAAATGGFIAQIVGIMNDEHVGSCLKHFPGYGPNVDTHTGIARDSRSAESFRENDFIPFEYGIAAGVPSIMVNHNIVEAFDDSLPASLSPAVHSVLRNELGFEGVIISDDLGMDAITLYSGGESPYVLAVAAGNDMLCTSDIETAYNDVLAAVKDGRLSEDTLDESVDRILKMKSDLGIA